MSIITLQTLNQKQREEINQLITTCNENDKLKRRPVMEEGDNYNLSIKSYYCFYKEDILISALILYQPFPEEAEISAYTLPLYRRQGYFKALYQEALKELKKYHVSIAVLVVEHNSVSGKASAEALKTKRSRSDYLMMYDIITELPFKKEIPENFTMEQLNSSNLNGGIEIFQQIFGWEKEAVQENMEHALADPNTLTFLSRIDGVINGTVSIHLSRIEASIYGFGIRKQDRDTGLGKAFLLWILSVLKDMGKTKVVLQVESESAEAFYLYKKFGFKIQEQYDYYYKKI